MFKFTRLACVLMAICSLAVFVSAADAQQATYYYTYPQPQSASLHYHRFYQGTNWAWSPGSGWYQYQSYIDVPHWTPAPSYLYPFWITPW
jgi:hypothetical protein